MSIRWFYRNDAGSIAEMSDRVQFAGAPKEGTDGLVTNAEEGSVARAQIIVNDPDGTFSVRGHRIIYARETEAEDDDFAGLMGIYYANVREVREGSPFDGVGRDWTIDLDDLNTVFDRRIMRGSDANRPAETDVERIQWLEATSECSLIDDTTYLSTAAPVDMDACDYRNRKVREIFDDCAQQSGKNWYLLWIAGEGSVAGLGALYTLWYGHGSLDTYVSAASISNVPSDIAGGAYAPAAGSKLRRDPTRVMSGVVVEYQGGSVYRVRSETEDDFALGGRDTTSPAENVKTATKANARGDRYLETVKTEEDVISTAIVVRAADVNVVVHGMYVPVRFSWMPGYDEQTSARCLNRTVRPLGVDTYEIAMELSSSPFVCPPDGYVVPWCSGDGDGPLTSTVPGDNIGIAGTETVKLYDGATYRLAYSVTHAHSGGAGQNDLVGALGAGVFGAGTTSSTNPQGTGTRYQFGSPTFGDAEDGVTFDVVMADNGDPCWPVWALEGAGFFSQNVIGSVVSVVVTYLSGPDPRFVDLPVCSA